MNVQVIEATEADRPIVANLSKFYVYDFTEYTRWPVPDDGMFTCKDLAHYWDEPDHHPFVVRVDDELAGFAFVAQLEDSPDPLFDIGEFFILRKFRRKGVGQFVAHCLFRRFPGRWQVRQLPPNTVATAFWRAVIHRFAGEDLRESVEFFPRYDREMVVQRFQSPANP